MRVRTLSALILLPMLSVLLTAVPAQAAGTSGKTTSGPVSGLWKSSATRRPAIVSVPRLLTTAPTPAQAYQDRVLLLTNDQRRSRGLAPLALSACADRYADSWAASQAQRDTMGHQALAPILTDCRASMVGENVAYGSMTPDALVAMWMGSAGHRENILRPEFTHLGVGAVQTATGRWYGVQVFVRL